MKWSEVDWTLQDAAGDGPEGQVARRVFRTASTGRHQLQLSMLNHLDPFGTIWIPGFDSHVQESANQCNF